MHTIDFLMLAAVFTVFIEVIWQVWKDFRSKGHMSD